MISRIVTVKEDENGLYVLFLPQFHNACVGNVKGRFVIRMPNKPNVYDSGIVYFKAGEKVVVQPFNQNMGWYKVRRKSAGEATLWDGPRLENNGFTTCWVPHDH